jgi:imidazolonepropionase-like amidohydrolase
MWSLLGMTPQQALHAATAVAAELLGLHHGIIAIGEPADLLLLDGDVGQDIRALQRRQAVMKAGAFITA